MSTLSSHARQWPEVLDIVARFCTLRESENTRTFENCTRFAFHVQFSHVRVFSDSRIVQKSVTRIIYLGPLPIDQQHFIQAPHIGDKNIRGQT